jgi:hypothetical protein
MRVNRQLAALETMILTPLDDVQKEAWHRAPAGRWSVAQVLSHLALGLDAVVRKLEERKDRTDLTRRATPKQHLLRHLILGVGRIPRVRRAVAGTAPVDRPDPEMAMAQFRMAIQRLEVLVEGIPEEQQQRIFVQHPAVGDLNLPEWVRFFFVHNRHHAHQIRVRLRWLARLRRKARPPTGQPERRRKAKAKAKG